VLWLLDGVLQCQPFMFSRGFARQILAPAGVGQPRVIASLVHATVAIVASHPAATNMLFALTQLLLGVALFTRRFARPALAASIVWALSVWIAGEGLGGLATGVTILSGAPGAALLYAVIAVLAWPAREDQGDARPSWSALPIWSTLWIVAAVLQLIDGNNSSTSLTTMLRMSGSGAPGWIAGIDRQLGGLRPPGWTASGLIAIYVLVAIWAVIPGWTRQFSIALGLFIAMASWLLVQGLGDLTSGNATDPNAGPLIMLLAVAVVGANTRDVCDEAPPLSVASDPIPGSILVSNCR
jgi:hypothetical protein